MNGKKFIEYAREQLESKDFSLFLRDSKYLIADGVKVHGFFDEINQQIVCAINRPLHKWLPLFVHEFSHFEQSQTECRAWKQLLDENQKDKTDDLFKWFKGQRYPKTHIEDMARRLRICELDCERRAVANIRRFHLPIDIEEYCQRANAYIYFYNYAVLRRRWWKKDLAPYDIKNVYSLFPSNLNQKYNHLPNKYVRIYDEFC